MRLHFFCPMRGRARISKRRGRCRPRLFVQNAAVIETTAVLPAIEEPSLVEEKFGWR